MSADGVAFLASVPIGRTPGGEPVYVDQTWLLNLLALRDRTGGYAKNFIADALSAAAGAQGAADGKIASIWQNDPPNVANFDEGDLWFDTNDGNKVYQLRAGGWVNAQDSAIGTAISAAAGAQAIANTKIITFFQTSQPTASEVGDLWHDTDDPQRRTYRWNGSTWQDIADKTPFNVAAAIAGQGDLATLSAIATMPFPPGAQIGAVGDLAFTPNQGGAGDPNDGEIGVQGTILYVPDRGKVTIAQTQILTAYEGGGLTGRGFIILSSTNTATRFAARFGSLLLLITIPCAIFSA